MKNIYLEYAKLITENVKSENIHINTFVLSFLSNSNRDEFDDFNVLGEKPPSNLLTEKFLNTINSSKYREGLLLLFIKRFYSVSKEISFNWQTLFPEQPIFDSLDTVNKIDKILKDIKYKLTFKDILHILSEGKKMSFAEFDYLMTNLRISAFAHEFEEYGLLNLIDKQLLYKQTKTYYDRILDKNVVQEIEEVVELYDFSLPAAYNFFFKGDAESIFTLQGEEGNARFIKVYDYATDKSVYMEVDPHTTNAIDGLVSLYSIPVGSEDYIDYIGRQGDVIFISFKETKEALEFMKKAVDLPRRKITYEEYKKWIKYES
ncbi:MAG: hypothetical protein KatS3mg096_602 [Candidatus Parcubacteria bacterium]|nr:MAG: hypothetical protein KatS3mg096_602 [Candidatus Parcubacteria bacterium]